MLNQPLLFVAKYPNLNLEIIFLGTHHELQYDTIPDWGRELVESANILLHEGKAGIVFADPFSYEFSFSPPQYPIFSLWFQQLTIEEKETTQKIVDLYCKTVKGSDFKTPKASELRFWAVNELIMNFSYFARGKEIDHVLYNLFFKNKKQVISLDNSFLNNQVIEGLRDEWRSLKGELNQMDYFKYCLKEIGGFFDGKKYSFESESKSEEDLGLIPEHHNFLNIIEYANDFTLEDRSYTTDRNEKWINILFDTIQKSQLKIGTPAQNLLKIGVLCGAAHLPDLFARLLFKGFKIYKQIQQERIPLEQKTIEFIHGFRLQQRAYENLKDLALGNQNAQINWLREMAKKQLKIPLQKSILGNFKKNKTL